MGLQARWRANGSARVRACRLTRARQAGHEFYVLLRVGAHLSPFVDPHDPGFSVLLLE